MNRIYQARVSGVSQANPDKAATPENRWLPIADWEKVLWSQHVLFQTAGNYYTLCLAAMAEGIDEPGFEEVALKVAEEAAGSDPKYNTDAARAKAIVDAAQTAKGMIAAVKAWRESVKASWVKGVRRGKRFAGGYQEVAPLLGVPVAAKPESNEAFAASARAALAGSRATKQQLAAALLLLLEEADKTDLNQLSVGRLPFFCTAQGELGAVSKAQASRQEMERQRLAIRFRDLSDDEAIASAQTLDLGVFLTTPPTEEMVGDEAVKTLRKYWDKAAETHPEISGAIGKLNAIAPEPRKGKPSEAEATDTNEPLRIPALGRKPSGLYPVAAVFRFVPCAETLAAFREATASLCKAKTKQVVEDAIADSRVEDTPHFSYFTNLAFHREPDAKQRAVWFEFDLAAFVEAVKSPHRYYQDTRTRLSAAAVLEEDLRAMEGEGRLGGADEGEGGKAGLDGFAGDPRIERLIAVIYSDLGHLGEVDSPDEDDLKRPFIADTIARLKLSLPANSREYTLQERTLRSWRAVRDAWRYLEQKGKVTKDSLWAVVAKEQGEHRSDFGSARFYQELAKPENHCIWSVAAKARDFHADDPVSAWAEHTELRRELRDKQRPIRFTPAHADESPRYFIFPKKAAAGGKWGSTHELSNKEKGDGVTSDLGRGFAFTAGLAIRDGGKWRAVMTRIIYSAPRLRRDEMRSDHETSLESAPWLPPMLKALGLAEPPVQDFGNCRITLQAHRRGLADEEGQYDIQLTFPVEIQADKLIEQIGKQKRWAKRFNLTPDGEKFRESVLRWSHEKQPQNPPPPLEGEAQSFTFGSVDFGLHAESWAMHEVRLDGKFGTNKKGHPILSRAIATAGEPSWRLATRELRKLRLPGSDATVWRKRKDEDAGRKGEENKAEFDWRQELYGDRGRKASPSETAVCFQLICDLLGEPSAWEFVKHAPKMPPDARAIAIASLAEFSFPEQNDKLIVVARRAQSRLARVARWRTGLAEESRRTDILSEIRRTCGFEDEKGNEIDPKAVGAPGGELWIPPAIRAAAKAKDTAKLAKETRDEHQGRIEALSPVLVKIANRILPLRKSSWAWERVEDWEKEGRLHGLEKSGPKLEDVLLQGQRGLSIMRIEQIEELRRRFQSLNQAERRHYAAEQRANGLWIEKQAKEWIQQDFSDPCEELLEKIGRMKTQRVNQTAHMILAQVLGVRLNQPPDNKAALRRERDVHGVYEKFREPVDFIAIEDLSRYRTSQGRAPQENGRLMKWCHRAVRDKLRELCKPFGIPVLEVPAAYSSQFCARSGVIGFRAEEVTEGFETRAPWCFKLRVKEGEQETPEQKEMRDLARLLCEAQKAMGKQWRTKHGGGKAPKVTLVLPKQGGQIFVPIKAVAAQGNRFASKVGDADLNAAVNIGLRAVADPRMWEFFPRLRTERISGEVAYKGRKKAKKDATAEVVANSAPAQDAIKLRAREKRKWRHGETLPELLLEKLESGSAARETRQPNYFRDFAEIKSATWDTASLRDPVSAIPVKLVSAKSLFTALRAQQWRRCLAINAARLRTWGASCLKIGAAATRREKITQTHYRHEKAPNVSQPPGYGETG